MKHKARVAGLAVCGVSNCLVAALLQHGVNELADQALLRLRQAAQLFELLL